MDPDKTLLNLSYQFLVDNMETSLYTIKVDKVAIGSSNAKYLAKTIIPHILLLMSGPIVGNITSCISIFDS